MKSYLIFLNIIVCFDSCFTFPQHGREIIVENQTGSEIYVIDSLPTNGNIELYFKSKANKRLYLAPSDNYLPIYSNKTLFWNESYFKEKINKGLDSISLYLIKEKNFDKSYQEVISKNLYQKINIKISDIMYPSIKVNSVNILFLYRDTIFFSHENKYEKY